MRARRKRRILKTPTNPSVSNTRGHRPGSVPPLVFILPSRNQRANCPSAKKLIGQVTTGRTRRAVAVAKYQPHGGELRKGCDRLSGRNSSITRTARDCESGESLGRKRDEVTPVTESVRVACQWRTESRVSTPSSQLVATTGPGTRKGRRLSASAFCITPRSGDFETGVSSCGNGMGTSDREVIESKGLNCIRSHRPSSFQPDDAARA